MDALFHGQRYSPELKLALLTIRLTFIQYVIAYILLLYAI